MAKSKDWALKAAEAIWEDCLDRLGWGHIADSTITSAKIDSLAVKKEEIRPAWAQIIRQHQESSNGTKAI